MGRMNARLLRLKDQYDLYCQKGYEYDNWLQIHPHEGGKPSVRRWLTFQREKILSGLKQIQMEMQPRIFQVRLIDTYGHVTNITVASDDEEDVKLYLKVFMACNLDKKGQVYTVLDIKEIPTVRIEP